VCAWKGGGRGGGADLSELAGLLGGLGHEEEFFVILLLGAQRLLDGLELCVETDALLLGAEGERGGRGWAGAAECQGEWRW